MLHYFVFIPNHHLTSSNVIKNTFILTFLIFPSKAILDYRQVSQVSHSVLQRLVMSSALHKIT